MVPDHSHWPLRLRVIGLGGSLNRVPESGSCDASPTRDKSKVLAVTRQELTMWLVLQVQLMRVQSSPVPSRAGPGREEWVLGSSPHSGDA